MRRPHWKFVAISTALALTVIAGSPAQADAIDGDWCYSTQTLSIQGPRIRTPGGTEMSGDYSRHGFNYTIPASEQGAGTAVAMQLLSEETMALSRGAATPAAPEVWKRCKPVS